ncbi:MAG: hypothetical protein ABI395_00010 [Sphingobium sp.]
MRVVRGRTAASNSKDTISIARKGITPFATEIVASPVLIVLCRLAAEEDRDGHV